MPKNSGFVYLVESVNDPNQHYKIGLSDKPKTRFETLKNQAPYPQRVLSCVHCSDKEATEHIFHSIYARKRRHGEWFQLSKYELKEVQNLMEVFAKNPDWGMNEQYEYALKTRRKFQIDWRHITVSSSIVGLIFVLLFILNFPKEIPKLQQLNISENEPKHANLFKVRLYGTGQPIACGVTNDPQPPTNIRSGPGENFNEIGTISTNGTFVEVYERQQGWLRVVDRKDDSWGWVAETLVRVTPCR
jgi:hypothetical protein